MVLRQVSDRPPRRRIASIASENKGAAVVWPHRREQRLDEGRFSSAIRPQQAEDDPLGTRSETPSMARTSRPDHRER